MEYRRATVADVPLLCSIRKRQLEDEGVPATCSIDAQMTGYFTRSLAGGSLVMWLAEENGVAVASGGIGFYEQPPSYLNTTGQIGYVQNIYTAPAYRRRGIASHMLGLCIEEARARGCTTLRLHASKDGRPVYQKAGFSDAQHQMVLVLE